MRRHCGRVVKAMDLKSIGFSRAGSNPANVVFIEINIIVDKQRNQSLNEVVLFLSIYLVTLFKKWYSSSSSVPTLLR